MAEQTSLWAHETIAHLSNALFGYMADRKAADARAKKAVVEMVLCFVSHPEFGSDPAFKSHLATIRKQVEGGAQ